MKNISNNELHAIGPSKDFESIKEVDDNGVEYWRARELMSVLGYSTWRRFEDTIKRAKQACVNSRQFPQDHFVDTGKMTNIGHGIVRKVDDYKLDRYACYLVAQNGDPSKPEIARAQTYFAVQTRRQEILAMEGDPSLFGAAQTAGVSRFGSFDDAGYQGLYNMKLSDIEKHKGVKKGKLLDEADSVELAANIFRITQTEAKLKREGIVGDIQAQTTHFKVGAKIRETMKELGSEMPEDLKPEKHVKKLKKEVKLIGKSKKNLK